MRRHLRWFIGGGPYTYTCRHCGAEVISDGYPIIIGCPVHVFHEWVRSY